MHNFDLSAFGAGDALGIVTGTLDIGGEMNAFHARGPLQIPGLGAGLFDTGLRGQLRGWRRQCHPLRAHASRHRQPRRRRGHHRGRGKRPEAGAGRRLARSALATGRALHRGDSAALQQSARQLPPRRRLALCAHGQRRSVRAADRAHDRRHARRLAQGSPRRSISSISAPSAATRCSPARPAGIPRSAGRWKARSRDSTRRSCAPDSTALSTSGSRRPANLLPVTTSMSASVTCPASCAATRRAAVDACSRTAKTGPSRSCASGRAPPASSSMATSARPAS